MDYPKWAPADLVQMHRDHLEALALGPAYMPTPEELEDPNSCPECGCAVCRCAEPRDHWLLRCNLPETKRNEGLIGRMVLDRSMREFWAWAETAQAKQKCTAYEQSQRAIGSATWLQVLAHMERFKYLPKRAGAEKKRALGKIAKLTRELRDLIGDDEDGRRLEADVLRACMLRNLDQMQREQMRLPESKVWKWTDALPDQREAEEVLRGQYQFLDGTLISNWRMGERFESFPRYVDQGESDESLPWEQQPLEQRLAWWHTETPRVSLYDQLGMFAWMVDQEAEVAPIIKQRREDGGWRAYMIRGCAGILRWNFKTVPADRIADLAGAVLDESLTSDDVRPYLR